MRVDLFKIYERSSVPTMLLDRDWSRMVSEDLTKAGFYGYPCGGSNEQKNWSVKPWGCNGLEFLFLGTALNLEPRDGYVFLNMAKKLGKGCSRTDIVEMLSKFKAYLSKAEDIQEDANNFKSLTDELLTIEKACGVWPDETAEDEVKVFIRKDFGSENRGCYKERAWIIQNGVTDQEVRWFPHECKIENTVWACKIRNVKGYGLKAVSEPRRLAV